MDKKILLGSIGAVVILVLASFVSIVGFQSAQSTSTKDSPLFQVRTQRAINKESKELTCNYLRKGEDTAIPFPTRDNKTALLQKLIDTINKMDNTAFNKFITLVIARLRQDDHIKDEDLVNIKIGLQQIRTNPGILKNLLNNKDDLGFTNFSFLICTINNHWIPGCVIINVIEQIIIAIMIIIILFLYIFTSDGCYTSYKS